MGNRAVITTRDNWRNGGIGVYLHWNGGRDSVEAFLKYCEMRGFRPPEKDNYGWASLTQVISNFFGNGMSVGVDTLWHLDCDNYDNGVYIIEDWKIVDRVYMRGGEQDKYDLNGMLIAIDEYQPTAQQLGKEFFTATEVKTEELKIGDEVFERQWNGEVVKGLVIGFGKDEVINGTNVKGIPYTDMYLSGEASKNINNYLKEESYRVAKKI